MNPFLEFLSVLSLYDDFLTEPFYDPIPLVIQKLSLGSSLCQDEILESVDRFSNVADGFVDHLCNLRTLSFEQCCHFFNAVQFKSSFALLVAALFHDGVLVIQTNELPEL